MAFLKNALMCITKVKLINHDCLPILLLLNTMLYIMLAYLMLLAAISNAVCLHNALFCYWFLQMLFVSCFVLVYWHIDFLFQVWFSIMRSAFNLLVFPNSMFTPFFYVKGLCALLEIAFKNNQYYNKMLELSIPLIIANNAIFIITY